MILLKSYKNKKYRELNIDTNFGLKIKDRITDNEVMTVKRPLKNINAKTIFSKNPIPNLSQKYKL